MMGSPPLTREPRIAALKTLDLAGITPAYAGTTQRLTKNRHKNMGSPPLTREPLDVECW